METKVKLNALIFNKDGMVLLNEHGMPSTTIIRNESDKTDFRLALHTNLTNTFGMSAGIGDVVFDDFDQVNRFVVYVCFLESVEFTDLSGYKWDKILITDADSVEARLIGYLNNTLFNPHILQNGNCYEDMVTGEAYFVIHTINDQRTGNKLYVVESTHSDLPMVLPASAISGIHMRWIPHLRLAYLQSLEPKTLAEKAKKLFFRAHNSIQFYGDKLYTHHLADVVNVFKKYKHLVPAEDHDRVEAELYGHDGIEDARLTWNDIKKSLNETIADGCYSMTNEKGKNRSQRAGDSYYVGLALDPYGEFKKLCDRLANVGNALSSGHGMIDGYKKEHDKFEKMLRTHGDTYKEMWDDLRSLLS